MGKGDLRHNPDKRQNRQGRYCSYFEEHPNGFTCCENSFIADTAICKGNPHNCIKIKYKKLASRSDIQKTEDDKI